MTGRYQVLFSILFLITTSLLGCDDPPDKVVSDASTDTDTDADSDADSDVDSDGDADSDSDGDGDGGTEFSYWTDVDSGLTWENPPSCGTGRFSNGLSDCCHSLGTGGWSDWRPPSIEEMRTLVRGCASTATGGACVASSSQVPVNPGCEGCEAGSGPGVNGYYLDPAMDVPDIEFGSLFEPAPGDEPTVVSTVRFSSGEIFLADYYNDPVGIICVRDL